MSIIKNLLIADIGGTNTRLQLSDIDGNILYESVKAGIAATTDSISPLPTLEKQLEEMPDKSSIGAISINLGGRNTQQVRLCFQKFFPSVPLKIFRESEGTAAYALGEEYGAPIVLMAGTGAIAVGKSENGFVITGGWGANIGDDGSGYDIGLQAIRMSLRALDSTEVLSPLTKHLCCCEEPISATVDPALYRDKRDQAREQLYPFDRQHIASLAKIVADYAEKGDATAMDIFKYAGEKLAELILSTKKKLTGEIPAIVVTGGLIYSRKFWSPYFESIIRNILPNVKIHYVPDGLLKGTMNIAKDLYFKGGIK